jgi:hypothetical protein
LAIAAGTQSARAFFTELNADRGFGNSQVLRIGIHSHEFNSPDSFANHAGYSIATSAAAAYNLDLGAALDIDCSCHLSLLLILNLSNGLTGFFAGE